MKRIICIAVLVLSLVSTVACSTVTAVSLPGGKSVDRIITGKVVAIDRQGGYATLYFDNQLSVEVTEASLLGIAGGGVSIAGYWTYYLHKTPATRLVYEITKVTLDIPENMRGK